MVAGQSMWAQAQLTGHKKRRCSSVTTLILRLGTLIIINFTMVQRLRFRCVQRPRL